jgi:hypothetical protein
LAFYIREAYVVVNSRIIELDEIDPDKQNVFDMCDARLEEAIDEPSKLVVLKLPQSAPSGLQLVDWLAQWQNRYIRKGKDLITVVENPHHRESLEFSHPDQNLKFCLSIDELNLPAETESIAPDEEPVGTENSTHPPAIPSAVITTTPETLQQAEEPSRTDDTAAAPEEQDFHEEQRREYAPPIGSVVTFSGEFVCRSCGATRMWLKGDAFSACENAECLDTNAGWKLTYELF